MVLFISDVALAMQQETARDYTIQILFLLTNISVVSIISKHTIILMIYFPRENTNFMGHPVLVISGEEHRTQLTVVVSCGVLYSQTCFVNDLIELCLPADFKTLQEMLQKATNHSCQEIYNIKKVTFPECFREQKEIL